MPRQDLTLSSKIALLDKIKSQPVNVSQRRLAEITGVPKSTIARFLQQEKHLRQEWALQKMRSGTAKRKRNGKAPKVEEALGQWLSIVSGQGVNVSGQMLKAKSEEIAQELGCNGFKATDGWLSRWKARRNIKLKYKSSETVVKEEQDHTSIESIVKVKEEPADDYPNPSTSKDTANEEFILPREDNSWTTSDSVVQPQFTLSVAVLAPPNESENCYSEQLTKKQRTNAPDTPSFASASKSTEIRPQSHNPEDISNPDSSKAHSKDQFDAFGNYVAAKLKSLDQVSAACAQKDIGNIIVEAEMGKYRGDTQERKVFNCAS